MPKRKATPAQLRNLAKGRKKLAAMRRAGKRPVRKRTAKKRNPSRPSIMEKATPREYSTIRLSAKNDASGNPRRIFLTLAHGNVKGVFDEEYLGEQAITDAAMRRAYIGLTIDVTPSVYNYWKRAAKQFKTNPSRGNFMTARNVLRTGRTTNPCAPRKRNVTAADYGRTNIPYIIGSIDPRDKKKMVFWGAFGWGPESKALLYPDVKSARKVTGKMKRTAVITLPGTTHAILRETIETGKISHGFE